MPKSAQSRRSSISVRQEVGEPQPEALRRCQAPSWHVPGAKGPKKQIVRPCGKGPVAVRPYEP